MPQDWKPLGSEQGFLISQATHNTQQLGSQSVSVLNLPDGWRKQDSVCCLQIRSRPITVMTLSSLAA